MDKVILRYVPTPACLVLSFTFRKGVQAFLEYEAYDYVILVPYFFSDVFELSYEFWGDTEDHDRVIYRGDMRQNSFSAWWRKDRRLMATFVLNRPDEERTLAPKWIRQGVRVDPELLQEAARPLYLLEAA